MVHWSRLPQYKDTVLPVKEFHYKDKIVSWPSYHYEGNHISGKLVFILKHGPDGTSIDKIVSHHI